MNLLTVFTPTYNRKEKLKLLYRSLLHQTDKNFLWLIVDDGSSDGTCELVRQWIDEQRINIEYVYQDNGGKIRALAKGIESCVTPWMICVDSDDCVTEDAVECMLADIDAFDDEESAGLIYPQWMINEPSPKWIPNTVESVSIMDIKHLYGIDETAILFRTEYLKKIEIPLFEGEKFLSEEVLYIRLAEFGEFVPHDRAFYLSEYQEDGMTNNLFRIWMKNPRGTICLLQSRYAYCGRYALFSRVRNRVKCIMNFNAFCMAVGSSWYELTPSKIYSMLLYFPSILWKKIRFT